MKFVHSNRFFLICYLAIFSLINAAKNCSQYSSAENDSYWDAVGKCSVCNTDDECGFCLSTLECLLGTSEGPLNEIPCPEWTYNQESCPTVPNCKSSTDCSSCAKQGDCAWCASENMCTSVSEAFSLDCRGIVFEPPCPNNYVTGYYSIILIFY